MPTIAACVLVPSKNGGYYVYAASTSGPASPVRRSQRTGPPDLRLSLRSDRERDEPRAMRRVAVVLRVAERDDASVGQHDPVAVARAGTRERDRLTGARAPTQAGKRAVELRAAEGEHAPVPGEQPVAVATRGCAHADDRRVQLHRSGRAGELGVAEGEDAAVLGEQPVAVAGLCRCDCD